MKITTLRRHIMNNSKSWMAAVILLSLFHFCVAKNLTLVHPKAILKTIKSEYGDIIDCVDIYKQPAFSHQLLANHHLQMKPSSYPIKKTKVKGFNKSSETVHQSWDKNEDYCPKGTVPITRYQLAFPQKKKRPDEFRTDGGDGYLHEYAEVTMSKENYYGGSGKFNVWNPLVIKPEFSVAQIWVVAGDSTPNLNSIEAGWQVNGFTDAFDTRLFVYWTSDNYESTGCYNLECPGFVQTSHKFGLGTRVNLRISEYGGEQYETSINIHKDMKSGNWWLRIQGEDIGYWPAELFKEGGLSNSSTRISWGGEITNTKPQGFHTNTDMGSGHFASEGWSKAAFIRNMGYVDATGNVIDAQHLNPQVSRPECYNLEIQDWNDYDGAHFYYGGPGNSDSCKM